MAQGEISFSIDTDIRGLPYVFEGVVPDEPSKFSWRVRLPEWSDNLQESYEELRDGVYGATIKRLEGNHLGNGKVGHLNALSALPADDQPSLVLGMIRTNTEYLPRQSSHFRARGVGSFLLDNLCALADANDWRLYLEPVDMDGSMPQEELYFWYQGRGFKDSYHFSPAQILDSAGGYD